MFGGRGNDTLIGAANEGDSFGFNAPNEGIDTIRNFSSADFDQIVVSASGFGGGLIAGNTITAEQFRLGSRAADASDRFIYNCNNGALFFDVDGTGSRSQVQLATLVGIANLSSNDIIVAV